MAFTRVGNIAGQANTSNVNYFGSPGAPNPLGSAATAGRILVVAIGKDNTATASGDNAEITGVGIRDSADTVTKLLLTKLKERTNAGAAAAATCCSVWWCVLPSGVLSTDMVKATFPTNVIAKALVGEIFEVAAGATVSADPQTNASEVDGAVAGSLALTPTNTSGSASGGRLVIRAVAAENNAAAFTGATSGWTIFTAPANTTGGGAAANQAVHAEYKIGAGNNATDVYTSNPTGSAAVDHASVMGALYEVVSAPPTPGLIKVWNGSAWVEKPVKVWNGSAWVQKPLRRWDGSAWVPANITLGISPASQTASGSTTGWTFSPATVTVSGGTPTAYAWSCINKVGTGNYSISSGGTTATATPAVAGATLVGDPVTCDMQVDVTVGGVHYFATAPLQYTKTS